MLFLRYLYRRLSAMLILELFSRTINGEISYSLLLAVRVPQIFWSVVGSNLN